MAILKAQGTDLYFVDTDGSVVLVGCPTSISGLDETNENIEITCLNDLSRRYTSGLKTPVPMTFTIQFDPTDESHLRLKELHNSGETVQWAIGAGLGGGDINIDPSVDSSGTLVNNGGRLFWVFEGSIGAFPFDFTLNTVVTSSITVNPSGPISMFPAEPTP